MIGASRSAMLARGSHLRSNRSSAGSTPNAAATRATKIAVMRDSPRRYRLTVSAFMPTRAAIALYVSSPWSPRSLARISGSSRGQTVPFGSVESQVEGAIGSGAVPESGSDPPGDEGHRGTGRSTLGPSAPEPPLLVGSGDGPTTALDSVAVCVSMETESQAVAGSLNESEGFHVTDPTPNDSDPGNITQVLAEVSRQTPGALQRLIGLVHDELHRRAEIRMAGSPPWRTLSPTSLVNELFVRLFGQSTPTWESRSHFYNAASLVMKRILVDRARRAVAEKRGGKRNRVPLTEDARALGPGFDLLELDEVLDELEARWPDRALLVRLRFFAELGDVEIAEVMGTSRATVGRLWRTTRLWIRYRLGHSDEGSDGLETE